MSEPAQADTKSMLSNSVGSFAELVAAGTPTPGGGSVAAYCGVLASALGQMMCNITIGKPKYAAVEPRLREINSRLGRLGARLRELIAEDAASFEAVLRAYRLAKDSDEQKSERATQIQIALQGAVDVPLETARRSLELLTLLRELADIGAANALSDVAVGAGLARAAVTGACYNVAVNLNSLSDRDAATLLRKQMNAMTTSSQAIAEEIDAKIKT